MSKTTIPTGGITDDAINLTSKVTGALPVANGGTALTSGFANGVTAAHNWRLTSSFTGDAAPIASNLEVVDTAGYGSIGSAMSQSSGLFTFPSTGFWYITASFKQSIAGDSRYNWNVISTTVDNGSNYVEAAIATSFIQQTNSSNTQTSSFCSFIFDVTATGTHKVRFTVDVENSSTQTDGDTGRTDTGFSFLRLGDT